MVDHVCVMVLQRLYSGCVMVRFPIMVNINNGIYCQLRYCSSKLTIVVVE